MRAWLLAAALLIGCGDNTHPETPEPGPTPDAPSPDGPPVTPPLAPCLDRPTDLATPPTGALTCDLLPPGFTAR